MTGAETAFLVVSIGAFVVFAVVIAWANRQTRTR
jgi:hypothetical protein